MRGEIAHLIDSPTDAACPAVCVVSRPGAAGFCLAAGHTDEESQRVATTLHAGVMELTGQPSASALAELLRTVDERVGPNASVSAAVVLITPRRVMGALAGKVRALWVGAAGSGHAEDGEVLAEGKGAGVGSGRVQPVAFSQPIHGHTLVVGTESVFDRASDETLFGAIRDTPPGRVASRLGEFARDEAGELSGAIALVVHRAAPAVVEPTRPTVSGRPRILFAEAHEPFVRSVTRSVLRDFDVEAHGRVAHALDASSATPFDVALVDYDLSDETGDVLVKALRDRGFTGPIIAVSAKDSANEHLVKAGANAACSKLAFGQIAEVIRGLLGVH